MTHDEMIAVIQADKEGKRIQLSRKGLNAWITIIAKNPQFNFELYDYRIKPEPLVLWAAFYPDGGLQAVRTTEAALIKFFGGILNGATIKKFVEATES